MLPSIFGENLIDEFFDFPARVFGGRSPYLYPKQEAAAMKTDIRETEDAYLLDVDLPGFTKENVKAKVENGYLSIEVQQAGEKEQKDENGTYIRKERYSGVYARSFFVGRGVKTEDITGKFENGILTLTVPKNAPAQLEENKYIAIEG